ncbi:hypothetical protein RyT2_15700 [Pseudolactococcus yaeyamensis]
MKKRISIIGSSEINFPLNFELVPELSKSYSLATMKFETSLISLMSEPFIFDRKKLYSDKDSKITEYLLSEYEKDGLNDLIASNPDIIILDFLADIKFGVLKTSLDTYLTNNMDKYFKSPSFQDVVVSQEYNLLDNFDLYREIWSESLERFMSFVSMYLPHTKIVINGNNIGIPIDSDLISRSQVWTILNDFAFETYNLPIISGNGIKKSTSHIKDEKSFYTEFAVNLGKVLYPEEEIDSPFDLLEIVSNDNFIKENNVYDWNLIRNPYFKNDGEFWNILTANMFSPELKNNSISYYWGEKISKRVAQIYTSNIDISSSGEFVQKYILSFDVLIEDVFKINIDNDTICTIINIRR